MGKYETPDFAVLLKEEEFEVRKYPSFYIVEYENIDDPKIKNGFSSLFNYISNDNKKNEKMSMTVPVIQQELDQEKTMSFVVPAKVSSQIPEPNNPNLTVKKFDEGLVATVRYSGLSKKSKQEKMKKKLERWIQDKGYQTESQYMKASYDAPFVLPLLRRNEIWVRINKA